MTQKSKMDDSEMIFEKCGRKNCLFSQIKKHVTFITITNNIDCYIEGQRGVIISLLFKVARILNIRTTSG